MKLVCLNHRVSVFGNHFLHATYEGETGTQWTSLETFLTARSKKILLEKLSHYPKKYNPF